MQNLPTNKPQWLIKLEQESWQAELIISGLAILGSLQLPNLIGRFGQWALTYFPVEMSIFLYFIQFYLFMSSSALIIGFILHFVFRAIWIGLIGINSVFPEGIKTDSDSYSKIFMENIKRDYSIENSGIEALDKICSGIFVACTICILVSCIFVIDLIILYGIKCLLDLFLPVNVQLIFAKILILVFFAISLVVMTINSKKYQNNVRVQKIGYKVYTIHSYVIFHVFRKPYFYLTNLIMSNVNKTQFIGWMFAGFIPITLLSMYHLLGSNNIFLMDQSGPIYSTLIESELIEGKMMKVFVPIFDNENIIYSAYCGEYIDQEDLDSKENTKEARQFYIDCYNKYHRVSINEKIISTDFIKHDHPHRGTFGILTYLSTDGFKKGQNFLKVEKLTVDSVYRTMVVPFWFVGD